MRLDPSTSGYPDQAAKRICCPLLIIRGENDHLFSKQDAEELQNMVSGSQLATIPGAGHDVHKERTQAVVELMGEFFAA
jgi:pimeloyl-ACP methyl ester carboxylesterase